MKSLLLTFSCLLALITVQAQQNPVSWKFSSKKIADKVYELRATAVIQGGWHLYSQRQPEDAVALPTKFSFSNNPLVKLDGKVAEQGKLEKFHDASINVSAHQYSKTVTFVQKITLKAPAKTNVAGTVTFQTCDDKQCLPPKKVPFKFDLG